MSKIKYSDDVVNRAINLRISGKSIPEITEETGIKKPSLQKIFQKNNITLTPEQKEIALARRWLNHKPIKDGLKQCSKCGDWKPIYEFHKNKNRVSGTVSACKDCYSIYYEQNSDVIKARVAKYQEKNPELVRQWDRNRYLEKKDEYIESAARWVKKNPEKRKEIQKNYDKRNQKEKNARTAKYRAIKIQATPQWLSEQQLEEIQRIYINCPQGFDVDHVVPLRGKDVRGLHVPWNLQYLPHLDNMKKSNKI